MSSSICLQTRVISQNAAIHPLATIQSLRDADQPVRKVPSRDGYPRRIVQRRWEMKNPAVQCIWHPRSPPFSSDASMASFLSMVGGCPRAGKNCGLSGDRVVGASVGRATRWLVDEACRLPWPTRCAPSKSLAGEASASSTITVPQPFSAHHHSSRRHARTVPVVIPTRPRSRCIAVCAALRQHSQYDLESHRARPTPSASQGRRRKPPVATGATRQHSIPSATGFWVDTRPCSVLTYQFSRCLLFEPQRAVSMCRRRLPCFGASRAAAHISIYLRLFRCRQPVAFLARARRIALNVRASVDPSSSTSQTRALAAAVTAELTLAAERSKRPGATRRAGAPGLSRAGRRRLAKGLRLLAAIDFGARWSHWTGGWPGHGGDTGRLERGIRERCHRATLPAAGARSRAEPGQGGVSSARRNAGRSGGRKRSSAGRSFIDLDHAARDFRIAGTRLSPDVNM